MKYTVSSTFSGKRRVKFECSSCSSPVESPLEEAGQKFPCPTCGMEFITPGIEERQRQLDEIKRRELKEENEKRAKEVEASNERVRAATEGRERAAIEAERLAKAQQERKKFAPSPQRYVYKMAQIPPNIT